jgi:protein-disulfide isomerase
MCIVTYAVNFALLFYSYLIPSRFDEDSFFIGVNKDLRALSDWKKLLLGVSGAFLTALVLLWLFIPKYWDFTPPSLAHDIARGFTEDRHPWIGAETPKVTIVEFSDYLCFQFKKMHYHLRSLIERYPDRIRLVHRHFPMDHALNPVVKEPFHEGSAIMSALAIQAGMKDKFWEANDVLFQMARTTNTINTADLAHRIRLAPQDLIGALKNTGPYEILVKDIRDGLKLGITGTPTFVIDGMVYESQIPANVLSDLLSGKAAGLTGRNSN